MKRIITEELVKQFAEVSGDHAAIHIDKAAAFEAGYEGIIAHGMLLMAITEGILYKQTNMSERGQFEGRFLQPLYVPAEIDITVENKQNEIQVVISCEGKMIFEAMYRKDVPNR